MTSLVSGLALYVAVVLGAHAWLTGVPAPGNFIRHSAPLPKKPPPGLCCRLLWAG